MRSHALIRYGSLMDRKAHALAYAEARRRAHTPRTLGLRTGIPQPAARMILEDLTNRGELTKVAPGTYGRHLGDAVRIWALPIFIGVALLGALAILA